jgi:HTH-type transcriptional regulator/antitoxin HipB
MNNLSQTELAQQAGLTQATISRVEKGHQKAEVHTLFLIFAALDADMAITERRKIGQIDLLEGLF